MNGTAHTVWELAEPLINNSSEAYLVVDDSVQDKSYSQKIEMVKRQYSGNTHGLLGFRSFFSAKN